MSSTRAVELRRDVVAQPLRDRGRGRGSVGADARAARLRHLLARERDEAVHVDVVRHLVRRAGELEHRRPEQRVEVDDVLADEVDLLDGRVGEERREVDAALAQVRLEAREIADRRVEPDVEVLARRVRESGCRSTGASREMSQSPSALSPSPSSHSRALFATSGCRRLAERPLAQEGDGTRVREPEEEVLGRACSTGVAPVSVEYGFFEIGRRIERAALLARVAVLVLRAAHRAFALDVAVGQEHLLHRVVELLDRPRVDRGPRP